MYEWLHRSAVQDSEPEIQPTQMIPWGMKLAALHGCTLMLHCIWKLYLLTSSLCQLLGTFTQLRLAIYKLLHREREREGKREAKKL